MGYVGMNYIRWFFLINFFPRFRGQWDRYFRQILFYILQKWYAPGKQHQSATYWYRMCWLVQCFSDQGSRLLTIIAFCRVYQFRPLDHDIHLLSPLNIVVNLKYGTECVERESVFLHIYVEFFFFFYDGKEKKIMLEFVGVFFYATL